MLACGDPGAVGRSRARGRATERADVRRAAGRRRGELLPRLRRPAAAARRPGARPAAGAVAGGHRRRPDGADVRAHPGVGARRRPADPAGAAHGGLLPHPGAPLRRRHGRARRPRSGDLGVDATRVRLVPRDLEGGQLRDLVHEDDRHELYRALHPAADDDDARAPVFRLRGRDGSWRQFESVRTAVSAGLPGGGRARRARGPNRARTAWCCTCVTSPGGAAASSSSSGWPTPTT